MYRVRKNNRNTSRTDVEKNNQTPREDYKCIRTVLLITLSFARHNDP